MGLTKGSLGADGWTVGKDVGNPSVTIGSTGFRSGQQSAKLAATRSEIGIGALMPWNDRLYYSTYLADNLQGRGGRIGYIDTSGNDVLVLQHDSCHTGRLVHYETNQLLMGPCVIEADGTVHTVSTLIPLRVTGWARHIVSPSTKAYCITMQGMLYEVDLTTYVASVIVDMRTPLGLTKFHFKACHTTSAYYSNQRLVVVSNVQSKPGDNANSGILAIFDGTSTWTTKSNLSHIEITGNYDTSDGLMFGTGMDHKSPFLTTPQSNVGTFYRYRFPYGTKTQNYYITQEWMRIRPVMTERYLMNAFGTWFRLSPWLAHASAGGIENYGTPGTDYPRLEAVANYLDTVTDFCVWDGKFAIGTNNMSDQYGKWPTAGQSQSAIKFGDIEDIWRGGKASGSGYLWYKEAIVNGTPSDAMLMRGYDKKTIFLRNNTGTAVNIAIKLIDYSDAHQYGSAVAVAGNTMVTVSMPDGVSADWFTLTPDANISNFSAWVNYD